MTEIILRLEFNHVFPDEEQEDILDYLKYVSSEMLLNIIGLSNINPPLNFDRFISNIKIQNEIIERVKAYSKENKIYKKPVLVSREASLKLAEIILSNRELLIENNNNKDHDLDEINILKSFLIINTELNSRQKYSTASDNFEKIVDTMISLSFPISDLGLMQSNNVEFGKLMYSTIEKFEILVSFLKSKVDYKYLEESLYEYFNLKSTDELLFQVKFLLAKLLELKSKNSYKLFVDDEKALMFLNSLVSSKITEDEDFTILKNHPLYQIDKNTYSVIDFFFVIDKFFKSVKFILKKSFEKHHDLPSTDRTFFSFYNLNFSEECLMKTVLDTLYNKKYFIKKTIRKSSDKEPDYYVRHNNSIFLFENKDVLIAKNVKSSSDINLINKTLRNKFLEVNNTPIGIGQLVNSIAQIIENNFSFDDLANKKNNFKIYPILLVSDRIFEIPGLNYKLNKWYLESIVLKLGENYNKNFVKNLTLIDIDTLIYWLPHLKKKDNNFKDIIDLHLKKMITKKKVSHHSLEEAKIIAHKNIDEQLSPISSRFNSYKFPIQQLTNKFTEVLKIED